MPAQKEPTKAQKELEEKLEAVRAVLTEKGIEFTPENTLEELEELVAKSETPPEDDKGKDPVNKEIIPDIGGGNSGKKTPAEITQERDERNKKERADQLDTSTVFSSIVTNHGPKFVVVNMPKVDIKAFGKKVITASKLPVGTRVDCNGNELEEGQEIDDNGVIITE